VTLVCFASLFLDTESSLLSIGMLVHIAIPEYPRQQEAMVVGTLGALESLVILPAVVHQFERNSCIRIYRNVSSINLDKIGKISKNRTRLAKLAKLNWQKKGPTPGIPTWSPTIVLTGPVHV
jgi:hypothetical protein